MGSNCNVTLSKLYENPKMYVATVTDATSSSLVSLTVSGYTYPYLQNVSGAITAFDVDLFSNNELAWTLTGTGTVTMKILFSGQTVYYLKINDVVKIEGDQWSASPGVVTVTDILSSTHSYVLSFHPYTPTTTPSGATAPTQPEQLVEKLKEAVAPSFLVVTSNWVSIFILMGLTIGTVVTYIYENEAWKYFLAGFIILAFNFFAIYVLVPQLLFPIDLSWLQPVLWKPPTLELALFPLATQQLLQAIVMGTLFFCIIGAVIVVMTRQQ